MSTKHPVVASTNLMIGTRAVAMAWTLQNVDVMYHRE
jgi:hypothetical protein